MNKIPALTEQEISDLIIDYNDGKITKSELVRKYNTTNATINYYLKKNGIKLPYRNIDRLTKYYYDLSFFKIIDTEEKAYWLGFLAADGCVRARKSNWSLVLKVTDKDVIEKLQKSLKTNSPIRQDNQTTKEIKRKDTYTLFVNNKEMIQDLTQWGIVQTKTFRTFIPNINKDLIRHFIRGYFDGDGTIYVRKKVKTNRCECSITSSSKVIIEQISQILNENDIKNFIRYPKETYSRVVVQDGDEALKFLDYIYKNCLIYMDRKYNKYLQIKSKPERVKRDNASSKYFGVHRKSDKTLKILQTHKRFSAYLNFNKETIHIGNFYTELEAVKAYNAKVIELGLPETMLNKIEEISHEIVKIT